jgi:hypothetical protein
LERVMGWPEGEEGARKAMAAEMVAMLPLLCSFFTLKTP